MSWVLRNSEETLGRRLVLLVLADHAKEDGTCSWPSVETIARETRLSERQARRCLRSLEESGAIVETGRSTKGTHIYTVVQGGTSTTEGGVNMTPEPSLEQPSKVPTTADAVVGRSAQTVIGDVVDAFGAYDIPVSSRARGMIGKQAVDLLASGFDYEVVVLASVTAIRRGEPQNAHFIAGDLVLARAGQRVTRRDYERALQDEVEIATHERGRHGNA